MTIKNISNTSAEELAQTAYSTLKKQGYLHIHINRRVTHIKLSDFCKPSRSRENTAHFPLSNSLLKACVLFSTMKVNDQASHYFYSSDGNVCCVDLNIIHLFTEISREKLCDLQLLPQKVLVDKKTQTELMLIEADRLDIECEEKTCPIEEKISALIAIPLTDSEEESDEGAKIYLERSKARRSTFSSPRL